MERFWGMFSQSGGDRAEEKPSAQPVSVSTYARLAQDVYRDQRTSDDIDGFRRVPAEELERRGVPPESLHTSSGMHAGVYERQGQVVVSYRGTVNPSMRVEQVPFDGGTGMDPEMDFMSARRGTEPALKVDNLGQSARDWYTNARQALGLETSQHNDVVALSKKVNDAYGAENVSSTGHSKGGGEAQLAAALHGQRTVTFNPAALHDDTLQRYGLDPAHVRENARGHITSVVTRGEVVDRMQGVSISATPMLDAAVRSGVYGDVILPDEMPSRRMGDAMTLRTPVALGQRVELEPNPSLGAVSRHTMAEGVIPYLSQIAHLDARPSQGSGSQDQAQSLLTRAGFPFQSLHQPLGLSGIFAGLQTQQTPPEDSSRTLPQAPSLEQPGPGHRR